MAAVLDRVVPARRREKDRSDKMSQTFDSRFGDSTISAPNQGGWHHVGGSTQLPNEWDAHQNRGSLGSSGTNGTNESYASDSDYDRVIIVDDTYSPQDPPSDKESIAFPPTWPAKRSHSRNGSLVNNNGPQSSSRTTSPILHRDVSETHAQEYARLQNNNSPNIGPWNYIYDQNNSRASPQPPSQFSRFASNSPPPAAGPAVNSAPQTIEYTRSTAGSPSVAFLSPVSEDFAKDDPRHHGIGIVPLASRMSPQPQQMPPPPPEPENFAWQQVPSPPTQQQPFQIQEAPRQRSRSRAGSVSQPSVANIPRSRSVPAQDYGRATPPAPQQMPEKPWGRRTPSISQQRGFSQTPQPSFLRQSYGPPLPRDGSPAPRSITSNTTRGASPAPRHLTQSPLSQLDRQALWELFMQEFGMVPGMTPAGMAPAGMVPPAPYGYGGFSSDDEAPPVPPLPISRPGTSHSVRAASRLRNQSVGPEPDEYDYRPQSRARNQSLDPDPVEERDRGRGRSRSTSRNPNAVDLRGASRGRGHEPRPYMSFDDMDPEDVPLPASTATSRAPSRAQSRAASRMRDRAVSTVRDRVPSRATSRVRAPSRAGSAAPRGRISLPQQPYTDASHWENSDADTSALEYNSSENEGAPTYAPTATPGPSSRRPSIAQATMSSNGGGGMWSVNDYKSDVAKEADYLIRTMKSGIEDAQAQHESNSNGAAPELKKKKSGRFRDVVEGVKNSPFMGSSALVPDAEELWG